jgi:putative transposase
VKREAVAHLQTARRLHILLRRDGITIDRKKTRRLYREEGSTVRRRKQRKHAISARAPAPASVLTLLNQRRNLEFAHDQVATRQRFRILNIVDDVTRECPQAVLDTSLSGKRVICARPPI